MFDLRRNLDLLGRAQLVWAFAGRHSLPKRPGAGLHSYRVDAGHFIGPELNFLFDPKVTIKGFFVLGTLNSVLKAALLSAN